MDTQAWFWLFVAVFLVLVVLALIANARRSRKLDRGNPYVTGEDPSPYDGAIGYDRDLEIDRRRDADHDDDR
jgi:hypothetical protein